MADDYAITLDDRAWDADTQAVVDGLVAFNAAHAGPGNGRSLVLLVRGADGAVRGGLLGYTHWNWLFVSHLWVHDTLRGRGVGSELLRRAEAEAVARGCRHAHLDTFSFQAPGFYERHGYQVFGRLDDYPPGHARIFLQKRDLA